MFPDVMLLLLAAFAAGVLNAAAGGGTFLTLPALMIAGVPPVAANATGTVALLPGYVASVAGFREELGRREGVVFWPLVVASLLGGALGALVLVWTPDTAFRAIVPWLMLLATLWFAFLPFLRKRQQRAGNGAAAAGVFAASFYGGYFNGGLGIVLLALFGALGFSRLNYMNALKNLFSALLTVVAVVVYALGGQVVWHHAALMAVASLAGGYGGARLVQHVPAGVLRWGIVVIGLAMTAGFFAT